MLGGTCDSNVVKPGENASLVRGVTVCVSEIIEGSK
jgi:hypothetical protein